MQPPRISASSYSNTAPLVWSFLYGANHGRVELILDNSPARSAALLGEGRVDAALVPVIAYQLIEGARMVPDVCVGARERVRSVCLVTKGEDLENVKTVALDVSSRTSAALTRIIFREFLGFEPEWRDAAPDIDEMLKNSDAALIIGDPALSIAECGMGNADRSGSRETLTRTENPKSKIQNPKSFDLAELWHRYTGLGFVFAMWMTRRETCPIDFAAARDEGLAHVDEIAANYSHEIGLGRDEMLEYLSDNISYSVDESMQAGLELYFRLAAKNGLIAENHRLEFTGF
jgi:chorismate dehydratase